MSQEMLRKGYRAASLPRETAEVLHAALVGDLPSELGLQGKALDFIAEAARVVSDALSRPDDPVRFWITKPQEVWASHVAAMGPIFGKSLPERRLVRLHLGDAADRLREAWRPPANPDARPIRWAKCKSLPVPVPTQERLLECGFANMEQLRRTHSPDRTEVYEFRDREEIENFYLQGHCAVLAMAIQRRTGWQMVGIFDTWEDRVPRHVACRTPDGRYVDARGFDLDEAQFKDGYVVWPDCPPDVRDMSFEHVAGVFPRHPFHHDLAEREHLDLLLPELSARMTPVP